MIVHGITELHWDASHGKLESSEPAMQRQPACPGSNRIQEGQAAWASACVNPCMTIEMEHGPKHVLPNR
jgi:hypothetical protein